MEKPELTKVVTNFIKFWIMFILFFVPILLIAGEIEAARIIATVMTLIFGILIIVVIVGNKIIYNLRKNKNKATKVYSREISEKYSVAVASLIFDNIFEQTIDIPATVLSLIGKSILIYEKQADNKILVNPNTDISKLSKHEEYIYSAIRNKQMINPEIFRNYVISDAIKKGLVKEYETKWNPFFISILAVFIPIIMVIILAPKLAVLPDFFIAVIIIGAMFSPAIICKKYEMDCKNKYRNTALGNKEAQKLQGLKQYIESFSMLSKKEIEESILWEDYLAYAYMFKINKRIFKEFEGLEEYKNLFEFNEEDVS